MFNQSKVFLLRPITLKHTPFADGPTDTTGKVGTPIRKKFTFHNHRGAPIILAKKKYTWSDPTKLDKEGKPEGPVLDAILKVENLGSYNYEEYERNEFERMAIAESWPIEQVLQMLQAAPTNLEDEIKSNKKVLDVYTKKQADIDGKLNTVITNYGTLFSTYENVRVEVTMMAAELPALKDSPYNRDYFTALIPVVSNMATISFPELAQDCTVAPKIQPAGEAVAAVAKA